jgi:hypothetical protein
LGPTGPQGPPGTALGRLVDSEPLLSGLKDAEQNLDKLSGGVHVLVYGMVGWLGVITIGAIVVFAVVYTRLSRAARALDDAETGSSISSKSSKRSQCPDKFSRQFNSSIDRPDIGSMPTLYDFDFEASVHTSMQTKMPVEIDSDSEPTGIVTPTVTAVRSASLHLETADICS